MPSSPVKRTLSLACYGASWRLRLFTGLYLPPYVILTSDSLKIQFSPFALREYPLNRLQFYRKEAQYTLLVYEREDGSKEKIKLDHFALDQDDLAAILAALENPGG